MHGARILTRRKGHAPIEKYTYAGDESCICQYKQLQYGRTKVWFIVNQVTPLTITTGMTTADSRMNLLLEWV